MTEARDLRSQKESMKARKERADLKLEIRNLRRGGKARVAKQVRAPSILLRVPWHPGALGFLAWNRGFYRVAGEGSRPSSGSGTIRK